MTTQMRKNPPERCKVINASLAITFIFKLIQAGYNFLRCCNFAINITSFLEESKSASTIVW